MLLVSNFIKEIKLGVGFLLWLVIFFFFNNFWNRICSWVILVRVISNFTEISIWWDINLQRRIFGFDWKFLRLVLLLLFKHVMNFGFCDLKRKFWSFIPIKVNCLLLNILFIAILIILFNSCLIYSFWYFILYNNSVTLLFFFL